MRTSNIRTTTHRSSAVLLLWQCLLQLNSFALSQGIDNSTSSASEDDEEKFVMGNDLVSKRAILLLVLLGPVACFLSYLVAAGYEFLMRSPDDGQILISPLDEELSPDEAYVREKLIRQSMQQHCYSMTVRKSDLRNTTVQSHGSSGTNNSNNSTNSCSPSRQSIIKTIKKNFKRSQNDENQTKQLEDNDETTVTAQSVRSVRSIDPPAPKLGEDDDQNYNVHHTQHHYSDDLEKSTQRTDDEDTVESVSTAGSSSRGSSSSGGELILRFTSSKAYSTNYFNDAEETKTRTVRNECAICLSSYRVSDTVVWSSNPACVHVFHAHCIQDWWMSQSIRSFRAQCPCCRQSFTPIPLQHNQQSFPTTRPTTTVVVMNNNHNETTNTPTPTDIAIIPRMAPVPEVSEHESSSASNWIDM